jgi:hypothetical protein
MYRKNYYSFPHVPLQIWFPVQIEGRDPLKKKDNISSQTLYTAKAAAVL